MIRALFVLTFFISTVAAGPLYRWVDSTGKVHYSDQPPPQSESETVQYDYLGAGQKLQESGANASAGERAKEQDNTPVQVRQLNPELQLKPSAQRCAAAKQRLKLYQSARQIERPDDYGRRTVLSEAERRSALEGAQQEVERACAGLSPQ